MWDCNECGATSASSKSVMRNFPGDPIPNIKHTQSESEKDSFPVSRFGIGNWKTKLGLFLVFRFQNKKRVTSLFSVLDSPSQNGNRMATTYTDPPTFPEKETGANISMHSLSILARAPVCSSLNIRWMWSFMFPPRIADTTFNIQ